MKYSSSRSKNAGWHSRILRVILALLAIYFFGTACAPGVYSHQKHFDLAVKCLKNKDIPGAVKYAKNLPEAEKSRILASAHLISRNFDGWLIELNKAIEALKKRNTPEADKLIKHLNNIKKQIIGKYNSDQKSQKLEESHTE
ncbi:MAG: hypothetical protein DWQ05_05095 [Calditrichaeota bacterium]|nr:MAG: hypothetical protein DWQ05_05095 [Calditrichota bacterium]